MNERLEAVIEAGGNGQQTARNVANVLGKLDPSDLILAIGRDSGMSGNGNEPTRERRDRFRFLGAEDLMHLPPQEWLVPGIIPKGALIGFVSPPERYKTFTIIDLILSVAQGGRWL